VRSGPLRGRSEPMASALAALRGASQHGISASVVICGPAGIGKTALLTEICEHAVRMKIRVGRSKCDPVEQVWPGAPAIAALRAGRDPLITAGEYEQIAGLVGQPLLLADRIASHLEDLAVGCPLLIAIDDLQWADRVSRFLLRSMLARLAGLPVVWMFASRDDSTGAELAGGDVVRREHLRLAPLATQDLAAMARDRLGRVPDERTRHYLDATGGNPFLATQILDGLVCSNAGGEPGAVAAGFATAMATRLADLPRPARELVELIATAGRPLPLRDAFALMPSLSRGDGEDGLAGAVESGLITMSAGALTFGHDLVRETVYAILAGDQARQLHARLAEYHLSVLGEPLVAAARACDAATSGDLSSALILISAAGPEPPLPVHPVPGPARHPGDHRRRPDPGPRRRRQPGRTGRDRSRARPVAERAGPGPGHQDRADPAQQGPGRAGHRPAARGVRAGLYPDAARRAGGQAGGSRGRAGP
jgi:GTPase SAR1 family protein